jgi:hypothetical protein
MTIFAAISTAGRGHIAEQQHVAQTRGGAVIEALFGPRASPSTTAILDAAGFIRRLANAFGTSNANITLNHCG